MYLMKLKSVFTKTIISIGMIIFFLGKFLSEQVNREKDLTYEKHHFPGKDYSLGNE